MVCCRTHANPEKLGDRCKQLTCTMFLKSPLRYRKVSVALMTPLSGQSQTRYTCLGASVTSSTGTVKSVHSVSIPNRPSKNARIFTSPFASGNWPSECSYDCRMESCTVERRRNSAEQFESILLVAIYEYARRPMCASYSEQPRCSRA